MTQEFSCNVAREEAPKVEETPFISARMCYYVCACATWAFSIVKYPTTFFFNETNKKKEGEFPIKNRPLSVCQVRLAKPSRVSHRPFFHTESRRLVTLSRCGGCGEDGGIGVVFRFYHLEVPRWHSSRQVSR